MREFDFLSPRTLDEAVQMLAQGDGQIQLLAGGTDLLLHMREGTVAPGIVMSLKQLSELRKIEATDEAGLRIGAMATLRQVARSPELQRQAPCLVETALLMASEQIRSLATVGGNLCNAAPSADMAPPLIALDAAVRIIGPAGERRLPLEEFFLGPGQTALQPNELLAEIEVPSTLRATRYLRLTPRANMDIAVVGVAAGLQLVDGAVSSARVVLGAVAPVPLRVRAAEDALLGQELSTETIRTAATIAAQACSPISDVRGSEWYRRRMVDVLVRRTFNALSETVAVAA